MDPDALISLIGLNLPKIYAVNRMTEWLQEEIKALGFWSTVSPFAIALPFLVAMAMSSMSEDDCGAVIGSGLLYGAAAIAVHHLHGGSEEEDQPP